MTISCARCLCPHHCCQVLLPCRTEAFASLHHSVMPNSQAFACRCDEQLSPYLLACCNTVQMAPAAARQLTITIRCLEIITFRALADVTAEGVLAGAELLLALGVCPAAMTLCRAVVFLHAACQAHLQPQCIVLVHADHACIIHRVPDMQAICTYCAATLGCIGVCPAAMPSCALLEGFPATLWDNMLIQDADLKVLGWPPKLAHLLHHQLSTHNRTNTGREGG